MFRPSVIGHLQGAHWFLSTSAAYASTWVADILHVRQKPVAKIKIRRFLKSAKHNKITVIG